MATFLSFGNSVVNNAGVTAASGQAGGTVSLNSGTQSFSDTSILKFYTDKATGIGELNSTVKIVKIEVFASRADYEAGNVQYTYLPTGGSKGGSLVSGSAGNGDTFLTFDASKLTSTDVGAPKLSNVFVAPGTQAAHKIGSLTLQNHTDLDLDGNGKIQGNLEHGNGLFYTGLPICFTPGARIGTTKGNVAVENLAVGDMVFTRDNGPQPIRWIGRRALTAVELSLTPTLNPVRLRAGALGDGLPERDMVLSPNHRILYTGPLASLHFDESEVLVAAKDLTKRPGIRRDPAPQGVTYVHLMFDQHQVILSDGAWTESFQPGDYSLKGLATAQRREIFALFPELTQARGLAAFTAARHTPKSSEVPVLFG